MKRKIICSIVAFLFLGFSLSAQQYKTAQFKYIRLPSEPLASNVKTYKVNASFSNDESNDVGYDLRTAAKLEALREDKFPDLEINVSLQPFYYASPQIQEKPIPMSMDANAKEYYYRIDYRYPITVVVFDKINNKKLYDGIINGSNRQYNTSSYATPEKLNNAWQGGKDHIYKLRSDALHQSLREMGELIKSKFDFYTSSASQTIWCPKSKKVDYSDLENALAKALDAYTSITPDRVHGFDSFKENIEEPIGIWLNALKEADLSNKKARINGDIDYRIRENLAWAYYWMADVEKANQCIEEARKVHKRVGWADELLKAIADFQFRLKANETSAN